MVKSFLAVGLGCLCALTAFDTASAQSSLTVHRRSGIPLPANVTTSDDWLDVGNVVPEGSMNRYAAPEENDPFNGITVGPQVGPNMNQNW
jgi:hypothetical protein